MVARKVAVVIHEGVQALDVAGPLDVFNEANSYVADPYETLLIAPSYAPVRASNGMQMVADLDYAGDPRAYAPDHRFGYCWS